MAQIVGSIIVAFITGGLALVGVIVTSKNTHDDFVHKLETSQAVTNTRLDQLTEEVRKHNEFGDRITTVEVKVDNIERRVRTLENEQ